MPELFANGAASTLASGISDSDLSLTLATGEGALFPSPTGGDYFHATITNGSDLEIVRVTARSSDTLTIVRAQQSTSAAAFALGASVQIRLTAEALTRFEGTSTNAIVDSDYAGTHAGEQHRTGVGSYAIVRTNLSATTAPTVSDDSSANYAVGSKWVDIVAGRAWICLDASVGAAVWLELGVGGGGGGDTIYMARGFASGAAAGDRTAYERAGGSPFSASFTMAVLFQKHQFASMPNEQRLCGTTTEFATNGICFAFDSGYLVVRGSDNAAAAIELDLFDFNLNVDVVFGVFTFDSTTGASVLYVNGVSANTGSHATGTINGGGNFTVGAGAGAPGTTGATYLDIHGTAIHTSAALTGQNVHDWWKAIVAGGTIGNGTFCTEAWEATASVPTTSTWVASVGATDMTRIGSAADPTISQAGRMWFRG